MSRVLITGSAQGLGHSAATALLADGHQVVVHARNQQRAAALSHLTDRGAGIVVGDRGSLKQTRFQDRLLARLAEMTGCPLRAEAPSTHAAADSSGTGTRQVLGFCRWAPATLRVVLPLCRAL